MNEIKAERSYYGLLDRLAPIRCPMGLFMLIAEAWGWLLSFALGLARRPEVPE